MSNSIHIKHPGKLHKELGIAKKKPIPVEELHQKLAAAKRSGDTEREKELVFAINAHSFRHQKG